MTKLKGITFDWWGTLYRHREMRRHRIEKIRETLAEHGYPLSVDEVDAAYLLAARRFDEEWRAGRAYLPSQWLSDTLTQLEADVPEAEHRILQVMMEEALLRNPPELVSGAKELVSDLHAGGVRLGIISDTGLTTGRVMRLILKQHGILDCFQGFAFSDEIGFAKPNRRNFERALSQMEVQPREAAHVGDLPQTDIRGAKAMGMRAILITGETGQADDGDADAVVENFAGLRSLLRQWGVIG